MDSRQKYLNDPVFRNIVDVMHHQLEHSYVTPSELREAALLAAIRYESCRIPGKRFGAVHTHNADPWPSRGDEES